MPETDNGRTRPGVDIHSPANQANPYPTYAHLRQHHPVCQLEPDGMWAVSRYDDARFVLTHPELFSSSGFKALLHQDWIREDCRRDLPMVMDDPPEHTKYRGLVSKAFAHRVINALAPLMDETARGLIRQIRRGQEVDFLNRFAFPYVGTIIGHVAGTVDSQSLDELHHWVKLVEKNTPMRPDDAYIQALEAAILKQNAYFDAVIADRRTHPRQDLVTELLNAEVDGHRLTPVMLRNVLDLLIGSGFHTTLHALGNCVVRLAQGPDILASLVRQPGLIPAFIEEVLRLEPPVHYVFRQATGAVTVSDTTIPAGAFVVVLLAAANRDPARFANADDFDMTRQDGKRHLAFGYGPHLCLGAALARLEIKIALQVILAAFKQVSCPAQEDLDWTYPSMVRGLTSLPVTFH